MSSVNEKLAYIDQMTRDQIEAQSKILTRMENVKPKHEENKI